MKSFSIERPLRGEKLAVVVPPPATFIAETDRRARLNFFPGRHLTGEALTDEHRFRVQRLLLRGQIVLPGIAQGLETTCDITGANGEFTFRPGFGLAASGEDIWLDRTFVLKAAEIPVFDPAQDKLIKRLGDLTLPLPQPTAAILVWQPVSIPDVDIPRAAIPEGFDQNFSPLLPEPDDQAFYRHTFVDGSRVIFCLWPEAWRKLPAYSGRWRNELVWEIFAAERAGATAPWLAAGLPVALVGFDENLRPLFVDRHAVSRPGGRTRIRPLRPQIGEVRLWQAQSDQFAAQLSELESAATGLVHFRHVPPFGCLPKTFFDFNKLPGPPEVWQFQQTFFPPTYSIEVAVAPLEQLDIVFAESRSLEPYDLAKADSVRLLLIVSQRFFDPQLLKIAVISDEFKKTVTETVTRRDDWRGRRDDLRTKQISIHRGLTAQTLQFPTKDPGQLDDAEKPTPPDPVEENYGTTESGGNRTVDAIEELRKRLPEFLKTFDSQEITDLNTAGQGVYRKKQEDIQADEAGALDKLGLKGFIDYLEDKVNRADSLVDRGFLKVNADVYRLGQLLGNNALGTQFATSASLANTVMRDAAPASSGGINLFASRLFSDLATTTKPATTTVTPGPAPQPAPAIAPAAGPAPAPAAAGTHGLGGTVGASNIFIRQPLDDFVVAGEVFTTDAGRAQLELLDTLVAGNSEAKTALENLKKASVMQPETLGQVKNLAQFADAYVPNFNSVTPKQLRAIPFERLPAPAAPKVRQDIFNTKLQIFDQLMQLDLSLAELTTDFVEEPPPPTVTPAGPANAAAIIPTGTLLKFHEVITTRVVDTMDAANADEAGHFSRGVKHADMSIAALRAVETRIRLYRELIVLCLEKLSVIDGNQARLISRLQVAANELGEARHDVSVAQALLKEEEARLKGINAHREKILREHVSFAAFHRPRAVDARDDTPVRVVEPALRVEPVPSCLADDLPQPSDFASLSDIFLGSPARWFKYAPGWISTVTRIDHLRDLMTRSVERAALARTTPAPSPGPQSAALTRLFTARALVSSRFLPAAQSINAASFTALSWRELSRRAEEVLTLGHLIQHGPAHLATAASAELGGLFKVGACIHRGFSRVNPLLRLIWAERYSQFDEDADFRNLSRLPRWDDVPFVLRRELQLDTDWLYSRVDATLADALALVHDLIRVALLLASHAPVDQLVTGSVAEPTTPSTGGLLKLSVDPRRIYIGMRVVVQQNDPASPALVHGIVEDIGSGQVSARITNVPISTRLDPARTTVRFEAPAMLSAR
jgi:hypothetical protein